MNCTHDGIDISPTKCHKNIMEIKKFLAMLQIMKTSEEILQMTELFIDDIFVDQYTTLKSILNCVQQKLRVFLLDIFKTNNKLPQLETSKSQEQLIEINEVVTESQNVVYVKTFKKLLDDNILICSNVVELAIFVDRCPDLLFKLLDLIKGNVEIEDQYKRFIIAGQACQFVSQQITLHGKDYVAEQLSYFFWDTRWYTKTCKALEIAENVYTPYITKINKNNLRVKILHLDINLNDYSVDESRVAQTLINNSLFFIEYKKTAEKKIKIDISVKTVDSLTKKQIFSMHLNVTRGVKITLDDILDKTPNRTYHLV